MAKSYAQIIGWGKCTPKAVLSNDDLATILDTSDEWIRSRTGIKERRISSVGASELAYVAAQRAITCAGLKNSDIDLLIIANCSPDFQVPNMSSMVLHKLGNINAAAIDLNSACTGFVTGLVTASAMIEARSFRRAVVIGAECMSQIVPWPNRSISVLFGDGAGAVVLEATDQEIGVISDKLLCYSESAEILSFNYSCKPPMDTSSRLSQCVFYGQEIFKCAVKGMQKATVDVLEQAQLSIDEIDLVVPHQANLRIIESIRKRFKLKKEAVFVNLENYANTSSASIPLALCEALEQGKIPANGHVVMPAFGAGLTCASVIVRWGDRVTPVEESSIQLEEQEYAAIDLVKALMQKIESPNL